ncbi:MAG: SDR family NAD(P)-dependent oxidoreductase [Parasphingopyxis sp.]|uniref:SDR family NAD(P)-dependent oxidoreductase n=1 Tax=Parasphingopyxis sp. TaxID=1920299 RepID=UPI0032EFE3B0
MRIEGRHAVVTGGGTGIGKAIARALADNGAKVSLFGRRPEPLETTSGEIGAHVVTCDVTDPVQVGEAMQSARDRHGPVTILVNNAGAASSAPFASIDTEAWRAALAVNLDGVFHCCREAIGPMIEAGEGRIVTIASTAGLEGYAYTAPYCAAKHGGVGLMRALAAEYGAKGITANAVCPGFVDTEIVADAVRNIVAKTGRRAEEARGDLARMNPSGRLIAPEEVADAVVEMIQSERNGEALEIS